jgi:hypothetical protein
MQYHQDINVRSRQGVAARLRAEKPQADCEGSWTECSPKTAPDFSAVAYFFGRELHKELKVPVGLIHTSWGGTPAESWTRREVLESDADFAPILKRYDDAVANYPQAKKEYEQKLAEWKQAAEKAKAEGKGHPLIQLGNPGSEGDRSGIDLSSPALRRYRVHPLPL